MTTAQTSPYPVTPTTDGFDAPQLVVIGDAVDVVQGFYGIGWDGPYGMTDPEFEFESDDSRG